MTKYLPDVQQLIRRRRIVMNLRLLIALMSLAVCRGPALEQKTMKTCGGSFEEFNKTKDFKSLPGCTGEGEYPGNWTEGFWVDLSQAKQYLLAGEAAWGSDRYDLVRDAAMRFMVTVQSWVGNAQLVKLQPFYTS